MSTHPNATELVLNKISKLAEQQKNQHEANEFKNKIFKQIHDKKLAENHSPITMKLEDVKYYTKKLGKIIEKN